MDKLPIEEVRTILKWLGEDPSRDGLIKTPKRFLESLREQCLGIKQDPEKFLKDAIINTNDEKNGIVSLRDIRFQSLCEHHLANFTGFAHIAYIPNKKLVGVSKLARVVNCLSKRLQIQENLTKQTAQVIDKVLEPFGVYVVFEGNHQCMSVRGVQKEGANFQTRFAIGAFESDKNLIDQLRFP